MGRREGGGKPEEAQRRLRRRALVLYDDLALTTQDPGDYDEQRFATVGMTLSAASSSSCTPGGVSGSG